MLKLMSRLFKIISFGCAGLITLVLIVATIIESLYGSLFVIEYIYHSYWFIALWLCLAVAAVVPAQKTADLICVAGSQPFVGLTAEAVGTKVFSHFVIFLRFVICASQNR